MAKRTPLASATLLALSLIVPCGAYAQDEQKQQSAEQQAPKQRGLPAEVVAVTEQSLNTRINAVGTLAANETIVIRPEQSGKISQILFDEGAQVKAGDTLFTLTDDIYRAELEQAQARVQLSRLAYQRAEKLLTRRAGSEQTRDTALAQLRVDQAQLNLAQTRLDKMAIKAPFTGLTGLRHVSPGDYVNTGEDLVELTDLSSIKVDFKIPEIYLSNVATGQNVNVRLDALPGEIFTGKIIAISPLVDRTAHNISLRARIPNPQGNLRPGLFSQIQLLVEQQDDAIMIPEQAILPQDNQFFVMKLSPQQTVEMAKVELGQRRPGKVEITSGLKAGDLIITAGQLKLYPGAPVTPIRVDQPAPEANGGRS